MGRQGYWYAKLRSEQDNLRSVLAWSLEGDDIKYALRLADALRYYWYLIDNIAEGERWCDRILEKELDAPPDLLAGMLLTAGRLATMMESVHSSEDLLQRAIELYQQAGDESGAALAMGYLADSIGGKSSDETRRAIELLKKSLETFRKLEYQTGIAYAYNSLGELYRGVEDYEAAQHYYEEMLRINQRKGNQLGEGDGYLNLSYCAYHRKQYRLAAELLQKALTILKELNAGYGRITCLAVLAGPTNELGDHEKAARLLGAAGAACKSMGYQYQPSDHFEIDRFETSTRQALGEEAFDEAWQVGYEMPLEEAIEYALSS